MISSRLMISIQNIDGHNICCRIKVNFSIQRILKQSSSICNESARGCSRFFSLWSLSCHYIELCIQATFEGSITYNLPNPSTLGRVGIININEWNCRKFQEHWWLILDFEFWNYTKIVFGFEGGGGTIFLENHFPLKMFFQEKWIFMSHFQSFGGR